MQFFLKQLCDNIDFFGNNIAFNIEEQDFTYSELGLRVSAIQSKIITHTNEQYFAVVSRNHIDTYATIFALWLSGKTMVPISASNPKERNAYIIDSVEINTIFDASEEQLQFENSQTIFTSALPNNSSVPKYIETDKETDLYILFTSGSTGLPKGVRISQNNIQAYIEALEACNYPINYTDRFLNIYDLTFDASIQFYVWPICLGARIYTLPAKGIKYLQAIKTLSQHKITVVKMTPSVLFYLQKYFDQIQLPLLRFSLFGAEALPESIVEKWQNCVPNAEIHNVYGPTEATVNCTFYKWKANSKHSSFNGIVSIGQPYTNTRTIICNSNREILPAGEKGELCLAGAQITKGYWKNEDLNKKQFFTKSVNGKTERFYATGDLATISPNEGNIFFLGRIDSQVQIDGHRVELGEIEHYAHLFTGVKTVAIATGTDSIQNQITLFVESENTDILNLTSYLKEKLPTYMIPAKIIGLTQIPLLISGKTDRVQLKKLIK
jgi:amino acid adenylation domain-containing protein